MSTYQTIINQLHPLLPTHIALENESINHAGYFEGKESHFKLVIVSPKFAQKRLVARHQMIYTLVNELMMSQGGTIHALAIHAYTPNEWQAMLDSEHTVAPSPLCAGQNKASGNLNT